MFKLARCVFSESCSREEFMCDGGRCLLPVSVCDGHPNCHDQMDEANCSHKHKGESPQMEQKQERSKVTIQLTFIYITSDHNCHLKVLYIGR